MSKTTKQFTIHTVKGLERVDGYDIDKYVFVYKKTEYNYHTNWVISDKRTGRRICNSDTRKDAIALYKSETMQERIKQAYKNAMYKTFIKQFKALLKGENNGKLTTN